MTIRTIISVLLVVTVVVTADVALTDDQSIHLDLPRQPLAKALVRLGEKCGYSIIFEKKITDGLSSAVLDGNFTCSDAFEGLLEGTSLMFQLVGGQIVSVRRRAVEPITVQESVPIAIANVAEEPVDELVDELVIDEISVTRRYLTGSRIHRTQAEFGALQLDILTPEAIALSGSQTIGDLFRFLPAVAGNSTSTAVSNGGDGTASVTLRGLPASHTLVLINGRRTTNDGLAGESADLNAIPLAAVERIEILKDGASAIYGSDAIAGVVNIITKREFDGLQFDIYFGKSSEGDQGTSHTSIVWGRLFDQASVLLGASFFKEDGIFSRNRAISSNADDRTKGGIDKRSSATPTARIQLNGSTLILQDGKAGTNVSDFREASIEDRYNFREATSSTVPTRQISAFLNAYYHLTESTQAHLEFGYTENKTRTYFAALPLFTGFQDPPLTVSASNIFNPFGENLVDVRRRILELGPRQQTNNAESFRFALGFEKRFPNSALNIAINGSESRATEHYSGILRRENLERAIGDSANCLGMAFDGCEPLNLFGPANSIPAEQLDSLRYTSRATGFSRLISFAVEYDGELLTLPSGTVAFATGVEYRRESTELEADPLSGQSLTVGGTNFKGSKGKRSIGEIYAELDVPLLKDHPLAEEISLSLSGRVSNYSDFGNTSNPKAVIKYRWTDDLLLRATFARGFRAPTIDQLHAGNSESFDMLSDPCALAENVGLLPGCLKQSDPTLIQFLSLKGGNKDLQPEEADSFSAGLVWTPVDYKGLHLAIDYFEINQSNVVDSSAQFIINENARSGRFADRVERDSNGNIRRVVATNLNIGERQLSGFDFAFRYQLPIRRYGLVQLAVNAARITKFDNQIDPVALKINLAGSFADDAEEGQGALPKWKANTGFRWIYHAFDIGYTMHYISSLKEDVPALGPRKIDDWLIHDVQFSYEFKAPLNFKFTFGMDNVMDESPPFIASAFNDSIDPRTYDITGRFWYAKFQKVFY